MLIFNLGLAGLVVLAFDYSCPSSDRLSFVVVFNSMLTKSEKDKYLLQDQIATAAERRESRAVARSNYIRTSILLFTTISRLL